MANFVTLNALAKIKASTFFDPYILCVTLVVDIIFKDHKLIFLWSTKLCDS